MKDSIGIQSYCFRGFPEVSAMIDCLKESGVSRVEPYQGHLNPGSPTLEADIQVYRDAGITIQAYGAHGFGADEAANRTVFEMAKLIGLPAVTADLSGDIDEALACVEPLCEETGVKLAIHNHGRKHRFGPVWALEGLFAKSSPSIGLCLDTAWMIDSGENPVEVAAKFADRLYGLHIKDFIFDRAGKPEDTIIGEGNLDLPGLVAQLDKDGFDGYLTLEYEGDIDNPVPATRQCVEAFRALCET